MLYCCEIYEFIFRTFRMYYPVKKCCVGAIPTIILLLPILLLAERGTAEAAVAHSDYPIITNQCEHYNDTCEEQDGCISKDVEECSESHHTGCFVLWSIKDEIPKVVLKGCFTNTDQCKDQEKCIEKAFTPKNNLLFCCCIGNMCNANYSWDPQPTEGTPPTTAIPINETGENKIYTILTIVAIACIVLLGGAGYLWTRKHKRYFNGLPTSEPHQLPPDTPILDMRPIQLIEIKARGRFGAVWKAQFKTEEIAVKVFPIQDKQSWQTEQEIFKLPNMQHPNILNYIGVEKRGDNLKAEFWLITAYHEKGSLCDYLKAHTLTWTEVCRIAESMARGLMHLHEAIPGKVPGELAKPSVAHRDFKSKNVLLKSDMTVCIADFGLAIMFQPGKSCGDTHGQVGTRRYMAPEVLEGAINFTPDAFLRIDMYACGLVLWELVSRCTSQDGPIPEYRLPFEEEVGQHPSLEDMQESVVQQKVRPVIQEHWKHHQGLAAMCDTMEECWDHDAEARLSASCVMERIMQQSRSQKPQMGWRIENEPLLQPIKESSM